MNATRYFDGMADLRKNPQEVTMFPERQLAAKVLGMTSSMFMANWDNPVHLRPDISPEMLEAAIARIFGKQAHEQIVATLPAMWSNVKASFETGCDEDDFYMASLNVAPLLSDAAKKAAWGEPATEDTNKLSELLMYILWSEENVNRFVDQAKKRLAVH